MKSKLPILLVCSSLLLSSCAFLSLLKNTSEKSNDSDVTSQSHSNSTSFDESSTDDNSYKTFEIYAINDFHGAVEEGTINDYQVTGLGKLMTYLKDKSDHTNTLLLDQGDTWQGSIYSNSNEGKMITDVMNYVKFDARTVGNHDFDWGLNPLIYNKTLSYDGYSTPVLAGNVYDYDFSTKTVGTNHRDDIGVSSVTYTLENGLKVGILGCIGSSQITSITSLYTRDICFTDHISFIKEEATKLRNEGCDIVIGSIHGGSDEVMRNGLSGYVDLMLCGHTHRLESKKEGNLQYLQFGCNGEYVGQIKIGYNSVFKTIDSVISKTIYAEDIISETPKVDTTIQNIITTYKTQCEAKENPNEIIANNVNGAFTSSMALPNLMTRAIYDKAVSEGYNVDVAYVNKARATIDKASWTYADLFTSFPFENTIHIMDITGTEFLNEVARYNYIYRSPSFTNDVIDPNDTYRIACIDYLCYHTDEERNYDYFPISGGESVGQLSDNYRIILKDWLKDNGYSNGVELNYYDYLSSNWSHDGSAFISA